MKIGSMAAMLQRKGNAKLAIIPKAETSTQNIFFWSTPRIYSLLRLTGGIKMGLIRGTHTAFSSVANDGIEADQTGVRNIRDSAQPCRVTPVRERVKPFPGPEETKQSRSRSTNYQRGSRFPRGISR